MFALNKNTRPWRISTVLKLSIDDPFPADTLLHMSFSDILKTFVHCPLLCNNGVIHIFIVPPHKSFLQDVCSDFDHTRLSVKTHGIDKITRTKNEFLIHPISSTDFFLFTKGTKNEELFRVFDPERRSRYNGTLEVKLEDVLKANQQSSERKPRDVSLRQIYKTNLLNKSSEKVVLPDKYMYQEVTAYPFYPTQVSDEQNVLEKTAFDFNGYSLLLKVPEGANSGRDTLVTTENGYESPSSADTSRYQRLNANLRPAKYSEYADLRSRFDSFMNWTSERHNPEHLSKAGFFYTGHGDHVRCFHCGVGLKDLDTITVPTIEHAKYSPNCEFLKHIVGESTLTEIRRNLNSSDPNFYRRSNGGDNCVIQSQYRHPEYQRLQDRLATFNLWPSGIAQTPNQLSEAGFFYTGYEDMVRCFSCNGGLKSWEPTDDPWTEHCRWFPNCRYANEVKGREHIALVQSVTEAEAGGADSDLTAAIGQFAMSDPETLRKEREYKATCLELGYEEEDFNSTLKELKNRGTFQPTIDDILDLIDIIKENKRKPPTEPTYESPLEENKRLKSFVVCMMCEENDCNALFLPCGHRKVCMSCAKTLKECLVCGRPIRDKIRTYLA